MSSTAFAPPTPAAVVDDVRANLSALLDVLWAAKTPTDRLDVVQAIEKARSVLDAVELTVVDELEAHNDAAHEGWASTKDFVTAVSGGYDGTGASTVKLARALTGDRSAVFEQLKQGMISRTQAEVIVRTIDQLPSKPALREEAERLMLHDARSLNASDLSKAGKHLIAVIDPEGDEREQEKKLSREERAAHLRRFFSITDDGAGGVRIKGRTTLEDAAVIKAALLPLAAPEATTPGACGGPADCPDRSCAHDGRDPRDHGARMLDALVEGSRRLMAADVLPDCHGAPARLTVTIDYADLAGGLGAGVLETGDRLSVSAVRRLACDAEVVPMVLGSHSEILDVGRTRRLVTAAIWKALVARDQHCAFPGCKRLPIACDAHHIVHWLDGGGTGLDNLALLCRRHHTMIHSTAWEIRLNPVDRRPEFIPPSRLDPERRPMRTRYPREPRPCPRE